MRNAKKTDLQPWLDYFDLLQAYQQKGLLEVNPQRHEAYVTQAALHAMTPGDNPVLQDLRAVTRTARCIRAYAGWRSQEGAGYLSDLFAVHVVTPSGELQYTLMLVRNPRRWWNLWTGGEKVGIISYSEEEGK